MSHCVVCFLIFASHKTALTGLRELNISHNNVITITTLQKLTTLEVLELEFNSRITSVPPFPRLRSLNLAMNHTLQDKDISHLTTLTFLDVSMNDHISTDCILQFPYLLKIRTCLNKGVDVPRLLRAKPSLVVVKWFRVKSFLCLLYTVLRVCSVVDQLSARPKWQVKNIFTNVNQSPNTQRIWLRIGQRLTAFRC